MEVHSQPCWVIRNDQVEVAVTKSGAHMAPVTFYRNDTAPIRPYYISPWQDENLDFSDCPILAPLRGDFFCLPFGGDGTPYMGELHPSHGETAVSPWSLRGIDSKGGVTSLELSLDTTIREGTVRRKISLVDGQNATYTQTTILGFKGKTTFAHHAILAMPKEEKSLRISTSPIRFGMTCPHPFGNPDAGECQSLAIGAEFTDLSRVPTLLKDEPVTDCSSFPARRGYADLLQMFDQPGNGNDPAWIAAVNTETRSIWYAFKDQAIMPSRLLWIENHGRHGSPWNGRNSCLGLEDACTFFDTGIAASVAPNVINQRGIPTFVDLNGRDSYTINYIQGVVRVSGDFKQVAQVNFLQGGAEFVSTHGERVIASVRTPFLFDGVVGN